jgi:hypothetical protein
VCNGRAHGHRDEGLRMHQNLRRRTTPHKLPRAARGVYPPSNPMAVPGQLHAVVGGAGRAPLLKDQASPQPGIEVVIAVLALERGEGGLAGAMTRGNLGHSPLVVEALDEGGNDGIRSRH